MANAFVEYFNNIGRIFTEKNAWYRILVSEFLYVVGVIGGAITLLIAIVSITGNIAALSDNAIKEKLADFNSQMNFPFMFLAILCLILFIGFCMQIFSNRMNKTDNLIPKIDFMQMFVNGLKSIPFFLVWILYYIIFAVILSIVLFVLMLPLGIIMHAGGIMANVISIILAILIIILAAEWSFLFGSSTAMFSRKFSYENVFNVFHIGNIVARLHLSYIFLFLANVTLGLILGILAKLLKTPITQFISSLSPEIQFVTCVILITLYFFAVVLIPQFAYACSIADITFEAIGDDNDTPAERNNSNNTVVDIEYENKDE